MRMLLTLELVFEPDIVYDDLLGSALVVFQARRPLAEPPVPSFLFRWSRCGAAFLVPAGFSFAFYGIFWIWDDFSFSFL